MRQHAPVIPTKVGILSGKKIPAFAGMTLMLWGLFMASPVSAAARAYASASPKGDLTVEIEAGQTKDVTLRFRNAGRYVWRGTGKSYVSLYATGPYGRKSAYWHSSWASRLQPARLHQAQVRPGETGTFTFTLHAPTTPGTFKEQFQLAAENVAWIYGAVARITVKVVPESVTASTPVGTQAYVVMDPGTGKILLEKDADAVRSIASITKLMTVMVARETGLDSEATVKLDRSDEVGGGRLQVPVGTALTVRSLLGSTIVGSANNTANALARATGMSREQFLTRMDAKALSLGLFSTHFADPTGIEVNNLSTAREVALMAKAAFDDPWIAPYAGEPTYDVVMPDATRTIKNTNSLVNDGSITVLAGKTGFINEAGYTLVTRVRKAGERELIVVVLGSATKTGSFRDAKALAERAWAEDGTVASR